MSQRGTPIIIAAPSGAGKTTLVEALVSSKPGLVVSVSHTTRPKRPAEVDGVNYHFVTKDQFEALKIADKFLESASVFGNHYGTSQIWVDEQLNQGNDVVFEIDWQGARQIREKLSDAISIFILPPSIEVLHDRLKGRGQDSEEVIIKRMQEAEEEMSHKEEFDHIVVNDLFEDALNDLWSIVRLHRLKRSKSF